MAKSNDAVPVALFVFNRSDQLVKTLTGLKSNKIEVLYVFSDGPRNNQESKKVQKVRKLIDAIDWIKVNKVYHSKNKGLSESIRFGLDMIFDKYDRAIILEDDIYVAPGFYQYMKSGLANYASNTSVACVTGLRYPFENSVLDNYPYDAYFTRRFSSWGWGTWKRFWDTVEFEPAKLKQSLKSSYHAERAGDDMPIMIRQLIEGKVYGAWDINCAASLLLNKQLVAWPAHNMVVNTGLIEGTHASGESPPWQLEWEKRTRTGSYKFPERVVENPHIRSAFLQFFFYHLNPKASRLAKLGWTARRPFTRSKFLRPAKGHRR